MDTKITIADLLSAKRQNRKIVAVSCYDYITAQLVSQTDVQMILVGDSAAQVVLVFESTLPATMDFMVAITAAAGAQMIKIEASGAHLDVIKAVSDAGMATMAHIGIRPQSISKMGKFKAEATTAEMAAELLSLAEQMVSAVANSPVMWEKERITASISVGLGQYDADSSPEDITSRSDQALYTAKQAGKNTVRVFESSPK